jgi:hypothetical protein
MPPRAQDRPVRGPVRAASHLHVCVRAASRSRPADLPRGFGQQVQAPRMDQISCQVRGTPRGTGMPPPVAGALLLRRRAWTVRAASGDLPRGAGDGDLAAPPRLQRPDAAAPARPGLVGPVAGPGSACPADRDSSGRRAWPRADAAALAGEAALGSGSRRAGRPDTHRGRRGAPPPVEGRWAGRGRRAGLSGPGDRAGSRRAG